MHDIVATGMEDEARKRGITPVRVRWVTKSGEGNKHTEILAARTTEPWIFTAGVRLVTELENETRRDSLHHRSSGLDSTTARLCAEHGVVVAIDVRLLRKLEPVTLGRTMQNITLCRRYKTKMCLISNAQTPDELVTPHDAHGLLVSLGMSQGEASRALTTLSDVTKHHSRKQETQKQPI
jgi:hypothetical protein